MIFCIARTITLVLRTLRCYENDQKTTTVQSVLKSATFFSLGRSTA
jgi:hypothetical protein